MNKRINIEKQIDFSKEINEITAISLEHDLKFTSNDRIEGNLILSGKYKTTLAAEFDEEFAYNIPVEISLINKLNTDTSKVDITDFSYDVVEGKSIMCKIELLVDGDEIDNRECDGDPVDTKELELPKIDDAPNEEILEEKEEIIESDKKEEIVDTEREEELLFNIDDSKETYGTFIVYMIRQNETINSILSKYNTTIEEIEKYNDIKDLSIGKKLIIPLLKDEDK